MSDFVPTGVSRAGLFSVISPVPTLPTTPTTGVSPNTGARPTVRKVEEALEAAVWVSKGNGACYRPDEPITIGYRVERDALGTLTVQMPDGKEQPLRANQPLRGGVTYLLRATAGPCMGRRLLTLKAQAGALHDRAQCPYLVVEPGTPALEAVITTNKGRIASLAEPGVELGPNPVFHPDEPVGVLIRFNAPHPMYGFAAIDWRQGDRQTRVAAGMIPSNTDVTLAILSPFRADQTAAASRATLILTVLPAAAAEMIPLRDSCAFEISQDRDHRLNIKSVELSGGDAAQGTKWNKATDTGRANVTYTITPDTVHKSNPQHGVTYTFDWGDGTVQRGGMPNYRWQKPGVYFVRVRAECDAEEPLRETKTITITIENHPDNRGEAWIDGYLDPDPNKNKVEYDSRRGKLTVRSGVRGENLKVGSKEVRIKARITFDEKRPRTEEHLTMDLPPVHLTEQGGMVNGPIPANGTIIPVEIPVNPRNFPQGAKFITRIDVEVSATAKPAQGKNDVTDANAHNGKYSWMD